MEEFKAVLFDFDDTLYPFDCCEKNTLEQIFKHYKELLNPHFESSENFWNMYQCTRRRIDRRLVVEGAAVINPDTGELMPITQPGSHSRPVIFKELLESVIFKEILESNRSTETGLIIRLSRDLNECYETNFLTNMTKKYDPAVTQMLNDLKGAGKKLALLTNYTLDFQLRKLLELNIHGRFDLVVTSEEAGADKPDPRMFTVALAKLEVLVSEAIMVGDSASDIVGAKALGIRSIHFKQSKSKNRFRTIPTESALDIKDLRHHLQLD